MTRILWEDGLYNPIDTGLIQRLSIRSEWCRKHQYISMTLIWLGWPSPVCLCETVIKRISCWIPRNFGRLSRSRHQTLPSKQSMDGSIHFILSGYFHPIFLLLWKGEFYKNEALSIFTSWNRNWFDDSWISVSWIWFLERISHHAYTSHRIITLRYSKGKIWVWKEIIIIRIS